MHENLPEQLADTPKLSYYQRNREKVQAKAAAYKQRIGKDAIVAMKKDHYARNRAKVLAARKEYRIANRDKVKAADRAKHLKRKYGLTPELYDALLQQQDNKCPVCSLTFRALRANGKEVKPHIDHAHSTGKRRSIIRNLCNNAIGQAYENCDILANMIKYLASYAPALELNKKQPGA